MQHDTASERLNVLRQQITTLRGELHALQQTVEPEPVEDYAFANSAGTVHLSELFGDKEYLFVIHNMGASCPACTMWADGFNGLLPHIENCAAFVITSPDAPEAQDKFKASRGWRFRMVSHAGTDFAADMGYRGEGGGWLPGVSVFRKQDGKVVRVSDTRFGPGDDFCSIYHLFGLLPEGVAGWRPKFRYQ